MKQLKIGVLVIEGISALIGVGLGVYNVVKVVKMEMDEKARKNLNAGHEVVSEIK